MQQSFWSPNMRRICCLTPLSTPRGAAHREKATMGSWIHGLTVNEYGDDVLSTRSESVVATSRWLSSTARLTGAPGAVSGILERTLHAWGESAHVSSPSALPAPLRCATDPFHLQLMTRLSPPSAKCSRSPSVDTANARCAACVTASLTAAASRVPFRSWHVIGLSCVTLECSVAMATPSAVTARICARKTVS